jgi:hypothetical protein
MSANLAFAISHRRTRFILVNDRLPRTDERCAMCGGILEKGYIRDSLTRLIYCGTRCFAGGEYLSLAKITGGKCHEMLKS